ncbi:MAG: DUF2284 domain-containing protein [Selenomonas sp.]|nr:DUF2284 domain-containing protein [Selenomonas sp.]
MDYSVEFRKSSMPMADFRRRYQDRKKFIAYCRECPRYDTVWSCPPLGFDADEYLKRFSWVSVVGAKIVLDKKVIEAADTADKMKDTGWKILSKVKLELEDKMRQMEGQVPGSVALSSGGCNMCKECSRKEWKPCRMPEKMRHSLDAFGFDLSAITKDMLGIEILWCRDRLPEYFTLIHGLMTAGDVQKEVWNAAGWRFITE